MSIQRVLVYGGRGALGATCVSHFKAHNLWVGSIDMAENEEADINILVDKSTSFQQQELTIISSVGAALNGSKLDGIFCVAGGWAGGNALKGCVCLMWYALLCIDGKFVKSKPAPNALGTSAKLWQRN